MSREHIPEAAIEAITGAVNFAFYERRLEDAAEDSLRQLAAMSPEDRAALTLWLVPEDETLVTAIEAATIKRVTEWLRAVPISGIKGQMCRQFADMIDAEFGGGPDAVK